ncbi:MAG: hypothetical protein ACKN89_03230 [Cyanobium sp.]|jgi:hypothetical protein
MPTPFWAALASLLTLVLWLITRRQPRSLLRSTDTSAVAALNRAQIQWVARVGLEAEAGSAPTAPPAADLAATASEAIVARPPIPKTAAERRAYRQQLRLWSSGGPEQRLQAMQAAGRWSEASLLPLLRRGLRDGDLRVMAAAAAAIAPYRGRPRSLQAGGAAPVRKVSRTR